MTTLLYLIRDENVQATLLCVACMGIYKDWESPLVSFICFLLRGF